MMYGMDGLRLRAVGLVVLFAVAAAAQSYDLFWHSTDGGGMNSTGAAFELSGTIGQPDAGTLAGGEYTLAGGFWFPLVKGDADGDGGITLQDHDYFVACMSGEGSAPPDGCVMLDSNDDGDIDLKDFAEFHRRFSGP